MKSCRAVLSAVLVSVVGYALPLHAAPPPEPLTETERECGRLMVVAAVQFKTQEERRKFLNTPYARDVCTKAGLKPPAK